MLLIFLDIVSYVLIGAAFGIIILTFRGRIKFLYGVISTSGAFLLSTVTGIYRSNISSGINVITATIDEAFKLVADTINSLPSNQMQGMLGSISNEYIEAAKSIYTIMFPAILILNTLFLSYVTYMIIKQILALFKKDVSKYPKFSELKLNRLTTVMLAVSYILPFVINNDTMSAAFSNISLIIGGVAFMCGLSYIDFKMRLKLKNAWFRFIVYVALFFLTATGMPFIMLALMFIAIADSFFNFRRLHTKEVRNDGQ